MRKWIAKLIQVWFINSSINYDSLHFDTRLAIIILHSSF